jgi:nicotinate-nucleotide pyrophosphorylase (carboxylating)
MKVVSNPQRHLIAEALAEDIGAGDRTTEWCVPEDVEVAAEIVAKADGVLAGLAAAAEVFRQLGGVSFSPQGDEGDEVAAGAVVVQLSGRARSILTGERVALNFLGRMSGIATLTRRFVEAVAGTDTRITDTRKTTPLWRELERAATRVGGAVNHRAGLDAMVLVKENHLTCAGGIAAAVERVRKLNSSGLAVEVETTNLAEVRAALEAGVDRIMLDNMSEDLITEAVRLIRSHDTRPEIEASGSVSLENVRTLAKTGVDFISVGALTHSAPTLDLSLRIREVMG